MLRKKLKLTDPSDQEFGLNVVQPSEFSLNTFINEPRPKLQLAPVTLTSPHFAGNPQNQHLPPVEPEQSPPLWRRVYQLELELCEALLQIPLPSDVAATYNPIEYAAELHLAYMQRFLTGHKPVLFLGMNPGPWGMCQTGVWYAHDERDF